MLTDRINMRQTNFFGLTTRGSPRFFATQPGDPDWSPSQDPRSQAQYPAAAAEKRLHEGQVLAENRLAEARRLGYAMDDPRLDPLKQASTEGFKERALTMGETIINWIDGPRQAVNLFLQDMVGGVAGEGQRDPNIGDYFNVFFSGLKDAEGFELATGLDPTSGSKTLDMMGWEVPEEGEWGERALRGLSHFALDVGLDPLTYLTFGLSALGKKVAATWGQKFVDDVTEWIMPRLKAGTLDDAAKALPQGNYIREVASNLDPVVKDFQDDITRVFGDDLTEKNIAALEKQLTHATNEYESIVELAVRNRVGKEVLQNVVARNFADIPENALELLPKFMHGGARISVPFTSGRMPSFFDSAAQPTKRLSGTLQRGFVIPGTRGLGRKLVGDPVRDIAKALGKRPKFAGLGDVFAKANTMADVDNGVLKALKAGTIEPWQYTIVRSATDTLSNLTHREEIAGRMNVHLREIRELTKGTDTNEQQVFATVFDRLETADPDDEVVKVLSDMFGGIGTAMDQMGNSALDAKVNDLVTEIRDVFDSHIKILGELDPTVKPQYLDGRTPHLLSPEMNNLIYRLYDAGGGHRPESAAGEILSIIMEGAARGGVKEDAVGAAKVVRSMYNTQASRVAAVSLLDDGLVMMNNETLNALTTRAKEVLSGGVIDPNAVQEGRLPLTSLNEILGPEVKALAERRGVALPKNWDGKVFNENPLDVILAFVDDTQHAIQGLQMTDALRAVGLAFDKSAGLDVQDILISLHRKMIRVGEKVFSPAGVPTPGMRNAPAKWLARMLEDGGAGLGSQAQNKQFARLTPEGDTVSRQKFTQNVAEKGVRKPVTVEVDPDGFALITDGNHRVFAANSLDEDNMVPVKYVMRDKRFSQKDRDFALNLQQFLVGGELPKDATEAADIFKVFPWKPSALKDFTLELGGQKELYDIPPLRVIRKMKESAFHTGEKTTQGLVKLYNFIRTHTKESFLDARSNPTRGHAALPMPTDAKLTKKGAPNTWKDFGDGQHIFYGTDGSPQMYISATSSPGDPLGIYWTAVPGAKLTQETRNGAIEALDKEFREGVLEGQLTYENLLRVLERETLSDDGARALYTYLKRKVHGLDDGVKEWLDQDASEIVGTKVLYDEFEQVINDMFEMYGQLRTSADTLLIDPDRLKLIGDDAFAQKLARLNEISKTLTEKGYDEAAKVMRGLEKNTIDAPVRDGFVNPQLFLLGGPALKDLTVQKDVANWMRQLTHNAMTASTPAGIGALKTATNSVLRWWRAMATIARPSFHVRNLVGGVWNNMIVGVGPEDYVRVRDNALRIRKAMREGKGIDEAIDTLPAGAREPFRAAWEQNVFSGFSSTEFRKILTNDQKTRWDWMKVFDVDNFVLTRYGAHFMESIEDFLRMSAFMRWYDPADPRTARVAREMVEAVHFNYTNLTPFETQIKKIIPFFVWQRRNIPLQISTLVENPRMVQRYNFMMEAMNENFGGNEEGLPAGDQFTAFAAGTDVFVNENTPFWARIMIDPDLPVRDLVDLPWPTPPGLVDFATQIVGPHIGTVVDVNREAEFGDVNAPAPFNAVLRSLAAVGLFDETMDGDVRIPYYYRTIMETIFPFMRETVDVVTGGPSDPNRQQRLGIAEDDDFFESALKAGIGTLGRGVGLKFNTPADVRGAAARSREEIMQAIRELRLEGVLPPSPP